MKIHSTTILTVRRDDKVAIGGDGQVTLGTTVVKGDSVKIRPLHDGKVLCGFAGSGADAFALLERFEIKLKDFPSNVPKAATELAKEWRLDRALRRLEAMMIVMDDSNIYTVSGNGDIIESDHSVAAIGSGGPYALAAGRALMEHSDLDAGELCRTALNLAGEICIYTNQHITVLELGEE